jgi:hypothetical protein
MKHFKLIAEEEEEEEEDPSTTPGDVPMQE